MLLVLTEFCYPSANYHVKIICAYFSRTLFTAPTHTLTNGLPPKDAGWQKLDTFIRRMITLSVLLPHPSLKDLFCQKSAIRFRQSFGLLNHSMHVPVPTASLTSLCLSLRIPQGGSPCLDADNNSSSHCKAVTIITVYHLSEAKGSSVSLKALQAL